MLFHTVSKPVVYLISVTLAFLVSYFIFGSIYNVAVREQGQLLLNHLHDQSKRFELSLAKRRQTVDILSSLPSVEGIMRSSKKEDVQLLRLQLESEFVSFYKNDPSLTQLRYIGVSDNGKELVRVERVGNEIVSVAVNKLQKKGDRDYFREALNQKLNSAFVSDFNLNRERGEIQVPHVPTTRVSRVVFDKENNKPFGIIIANYDLKKLFDEISLSDTEYLILYLTNQSDEFIIHPDSNKSFAFEFNKSYQWDDEFSVSSEHWYQNPTGKWLARSKDIYLNKMNHSKKYKLWVVQPFDKAIVEIFKKNYLTVKGVALLIVFSIFLAYVFHKNRLILESKKGMNRIFEKLPFGLLIVNQQGEIEISNELVSSIFGYTASELKGKPINILIPQKKWHRHSQYLKDFFSEPAPRVMSNQSDLEGVHKDGTHFPVYISLNFLKTEDGVKAIAAIQDASERKALMDRNKRLIEVLEKTSDCVVTTDAHGHLDYWNNAFLHTIGYANDESVAELSLKDIFPKVEYDVLRDHGIPLAVQKGIWESESTILHKNKNIIPVTQVLIAHEEHKSDVKYYSSIIRNMSRIKQREAELGEAKRSAEKLNQAKSRFIANTSHEIRTPMNAILGMLQLLSRTELSSQQVDYLSKAKIASDTLLNLINDILDFSKMEAGKFELSLAEFSLYEILSSTGQIMSSNLKEKPIDLVFDVAADVPDLLFSDSLRIEQVLINLTSNAIKFTEKGEICLSLSIVSKKAEVVCLRFSVKDTGLGIADDKKALIFEEFNQGEEDTTRKYGGTGLGLAITKKIIKMLGGVLNCDSKIGIGSEFYFELPLRFADDNANVSKNKTINARCFGLRVGLIEPNENLSKVLKQYLMTMGCEVHQFYVYESAFEVLNKETINMKKFDVWMIAEQVMGELELKAIKDSGSDVTVISLARYIDSQIVSKVNMNVREQVDAVLFKPILSSAIGNILSNNKTTPGNEIKDSVENELALENVSILLVEDNVINQQVSSELLIDEGAQVTIVENGLLAVEEIRNNRSKYDVILMDLQMPKMDGYEATKEIRNSLGVKHIPIIALTANAMDVDITSTKKIGMDDHVSKPIDIDLLVSSILKYITASSQGANRISKLHTSNNFMPDVALNRIKNKRGLYIKVLQEFIASLEDSLIVLTQFNHQISKPSSEALRDKQSYLEMQSLLHNLKGHSASAGAPLIHRTIEDMEILLVREKNFKEYLEIAENLEDQFKLFSDEAKLWLKNNKIA